MERDNEKTIEQLESDLVKLYQRVSELTVLESELRRAEETLKESEERFKILFEYAPDAYYLSDLKGTLIDGNRAAEEMIGYKKEELIGKSFLKLDLLPVAHISKAAKLLARNALGKATGPDEFILRRQDGSRVSVEISTYPVKIQDKTVVLGIARDVSKRKRSEEELQAYKEHLKLIYENVNEVIIRMDGNGKIIDVNSKVEDIFDYNRKEVLGKNFYTFGFITPKDLLKVAQFFIEIVDGKISPVIEFESRRKDGSSISIKANVSVIKKKSEVEEFVIIAGTLP